MNFSMYCLVYLFYRVHNIQPIFYERSVIMKKWECTVCGYIHEGEEPPEFCPVCGAPKEAFILLEDDNGESTDVNMELEDETTDIIVVGTGGAGLSAATTAFNSGLSLIVLEKASSLGGTTRRSGGRYWIPNNYKQREVGIEDTKEDAIKYMARYSFPTKYNSDLDFYGLTEYEYRMIENYYDNSGPMIEYFRDLGVFNTLIDKSMTGGYQVDYMENLPENKGIEGRSLYVERENSNPGSGGRDLIELFLEYLEKNNVDIRTENRVVDVILDEDRNAKGVIVETKNGTKKIFVNKGIIFGSGGFSHNKDLLKRFHGHPLIGGCAVPTNTGDLVNISQNVGAMLGNMTNAFRVQSMLEVYLANPGGSSSTFYFVGDSFIEVNKYGKRVVNEKRNYNDRTQIHYIWDPVKGEYPNKYMFFIFDKRAVEYWGGFPPYPAGNPADSKHVIIGNTLEELETEIRKRLINLKDNIGHFKLEDEFLSNLKNTINTFNEYAKNGRDLDFNRGETKYEKEYAAMYPFVPNVKWPSEDQPNNSMYPISEEGPYYAIILAPGSLDTNGGPMINENGQILRDYNNPIEGLYGAGNCIASPGINAYWGAGATIGPGMTYGYLAALHAAGKK